MDYLSKKVIGALVTIIFLLLAGLYLKAQLSPADTSVDQVLKQSIELQKQANKLNKEVSQNEKINPVDIITDANIPFIRLQSNRQQANNNNTSASQSTNNNKPNNRYFDKKPEQNNQNTQPTWQESENNNGRDAYSCTEIDVILCINGCCN